MGIYTEFIRSIPVCFQSREAIMMTRLIRHFFQEDNPWDCYVDLLANLPDNF